MSSFQDSPFAVIDQPSAELYQVCRLELLDTALTRARSRLTVAGPEHVWEAGVANQINGEPGLPERLKVGFGY